mgnify:CR=1 FL=1
MSRLCSIATLLLIFVLASFTAEARAREMVTPTTVVNLREGPTTSSAVIRGVAPGEVLEVTGDEGEAWLMVECEDGAAGYVSGEYVKPCAAADDGDSAHSASFISTVGGMGLDYLAAYCILGLFLIVFVCNKAGWDPAMKVALCLLGVVELVFAGAVRGTGLPWFCNPKVVGWVMTIVDFVLLVLLLIFQYNSVSYLLRRASISLWGCLALWPLGFGAALAILGILTGTTRYINASVFTVDPVGIGSDSFSLCLGVLLVCVGLVYLINAGRCGYGIANIYMTLFVVLSCGGLVIMLVQNLAVLIFGGIAVLVVAAMAKGSVSSSSSSSSSSVGGVYTLPNGTRITSSNNRSGVDQWGNYWICDAGDGQHWHR